MGLGRRGEVEPCTIIEDVSSNIGIERMVSAVSGLFFVTLTSSISHRHLIGLFPDSRLSLRKAWTPCGRVFVSLSSES